MQNNQFSKGAMDIQNHPLPPGSSKVPIFPTDGCSAGEATDPLASEGPLSMSSEWPTSSELETALLESDPFPTSEESLHVGSHLDDLFGDIEVPLPRDTLPSPPPVAEEPTRIDNPRAARHL